MKIARRRVLPAALLGLTLTTGAVAVAGPASAAGEPPVGSYTLDSTEIWAGQRVTLTQNTLTDDDTAPEAIARTIEWGDGRTTVAAAGETSWTHVYDANGNHPVGVTLSDGSVTGTGSIASGGKGTVVRVTASGASYTWQKSPVWTTTDPETNQSWQVPATWKASDLPAAATNRWTDWTDGESSLLASTSATQVTHYYGAGAYSPKVTLENKQGTAFPESSAILSVQYDTTAPSIGLTYPSSPNKASSWGTVRGRASDSQAGVDEVGVCLFRSAGSREQYYNFSSRKWVNYTEGASAGLFAWPSVNSAGAWSLPVSSQAKGWRLDIGYYAMDKIGNETDLIWSAVTLSS